MSTEAQATPVQDEFLLTGLSRQAALADIVVMILFLALGTAVCRAWYSAYLWNHPGTQDYFRAWLMPCLVVDVLALLLAALQTRLAGLKTAALGLHGDGVARQVFWGLVGAGLGCGAAILWNGLRFALRYWLQKTGHDTLWLRYRGPDVAEELQGFSVASVLTLAAVLAAAEEVAFRSIILPRLRRLTGRWWPAVLICSLLFGAFHWAGGPSLILGTMAISVAFCLVFIGARSLIAASIAHYLYNMTLYMLSKPDVVT